MSSFFGGLIFYAYLCGLFNLNYHIMTLLDFVKQFVRVHNIDQDWYYYESGDDPDLFLKNLEDICDDKEYYFEKDFETVEEALDDEPGNFMHDLVCAGWLTNHGTTWDEAPDVMDEDELYVEESNYEICIGDDYEYTGEFEIDLR